MDSLDKAAAGTAGTKVRDSMHEAACMRDKLWAEMSLEEKIERLRRVLQQTHRAAEGAELMACDALQLAQEHHHADGRVLKDARPQYVNLGQDTRLRRNHDPLA